MSDYKKAQYYLAKFKALSNAAEFIRSHGEEGFAFKDEAFDRAYKKECEKIAHGLKGRAYAFLAKYEAMSISIDAEHDSI